MKYHAKLTYATGTHYWWNNSEERLSEIVILPFINGQVVEIKQRGTKRLFNMKTATVLTIFRTTKELEPTAEKSVIEQINADAFSEHECTEHILSKLHLNKSFKPSTSLLEKAFQTPKNQVFVIMKFGDEIMDSAYEGAYKPIAEEFKLNCIRIDEVQDSGKISDQILEHIAESKFIIADLSGGRPNCYYECGFAHALGKNLILSVNAKDEIHFDLAGHRFIVWKTESDLRNLLRKRFTVLTEQKSSSQ